MKTKPVLATLAGAAAFVLGLTLSARVSAQVPVAPVSPYGQLAPIPGAAAPTPPTNPCPDGPQPIITSYIESGALVVPSFLSTGFLTPGFGLPFFGSGILALDRVTEIHNFNGVQGLVLTVFSGGFARPVVGLGVPDYLLRAYGGDLNAIRQDLAAGYLKCRSS